MSERYEFIDVEKGCVTNTGEKKYTIAKMCCWLLAGGFHIRLLRMVAAAAVGQLSATATRREYLSL